MNPVALSGDIGPDRVDPLRTALADRLSTPRPQVEIDLSETTSLHLGIVNVLIAARAEARSRRGDIRVVVSANSEAQQMLARVGIVGTLRP